MTVELRAKSLACVWLRALGAATPSLLITSPVMFELTSSSTVRLMRSAWVIRAFSADGSPAGDQLALTFPRAPAPPAGPTYVRSARAIDAPLPASVAAAADAAAAI